MIKISAVLPVRNEQNNIAASVRSLLDQVYPVELIVIDDCSDDATRDILETFRGRILETGGQLIIGRKQIGAACRRNRGNNLATGEVIMVCDAEVYSKHRSEAAYELFTKYPDKDVMYSAYSTREAVNLFLVNEHPVVEWDFNSKCTISHPTVCYRREVALNTPYSEASVETDMFEEMLFAMKDKGATFCACKNNLMEKIEGNSSRNKSVAWDMKRKMYFSRGIEV